MNVKRTRTVWMFLIMVLPSILILACGGGGGGGGGTPPAPMNQQDAQQAEGVAMLAIELADIANSYSGGNTISEVNAALVQSSGRPSNILSRYVNMAKSKIYQNNNAIRVSGSMSDTFSCSNGGSMSFNSSWSGPNNPNSCSEINNLDFTFTFNNCSESGSYIDGVLSFSTTGNACSPSKIDMTFSNLILESSSENISFISNNLRFVISEIVFSGDILKHVKVLVNGDAEATYQGDNYYVVYQNLSTETDSNDGVNLSINIGGSFTGGCLNGLVTLTTLEPILMNIYNQCPTGGALKISGFDEITVRFYNDGSLDIGNVHYGSCIGLARECT